MHLGIVHVIDLASPMVKSREDAIREIEFLTLEELAARRERLEVWSQICLSGLAGLLAD